MEKERLKEAELPKPYGMAIAGLGVSLAVLVIGTVIMLVVTGQVDSIGGLLGITALIVLLFLVALFVGFGGFTYPRTSMHTPEPSEPTEPPYVDKYEIVIEPDQPMDEFSATPDAERQGDGDRS